MKHLRNRIFLQILIPTLLVYVLLSSSAYLMYKNSYKMTMIEEKHTEMLNVSRILSNWISERIRELMIIAQSEIFSQSDQYREALLKTKANKSYQFDELWFISEADGYWNTGNQNGEIFNQQKFSFLFSEELLFLYLIPDKYKSLAKNRIILFAVPIKEGEDIIGILGGSIPLSEISRLLKLYTYKLFDEAALIDVNQPSQNKYERKIIVHTNSEYNNLPEEEVYNGVFTSNTHDNYDNYFVTTLINNWKFIGTIKSQSLFLQLNMFFRFFILITIIIIIVISVLSIGISSLISKPVLSLTAMTNQMIQGDFNNKITVRANDELQLLADAFNLLNKRNIQLRTNDRFSFLGRISSRMAHEIRHPLHIIQIAMQSLNDENFEKNSKIIFKEINNAEMFIREILEISKPNELSLEYYSMIRLIDSVYKRFTLICEKNNIRIDRIVYTHCDSFYFDVLKIEQVITNILNNSFDVTPEGGVITINIKNDIDRNLIVSISDTGPGFNKDVIDRVFDPYFTTKKDGTGLGLSICYQILTAHGAHIELSNNDSGGAVTSIIFTSLTTDNC